MSEVEIPDAAIDAADIFGGQIRRADLWDQLERAAPLIVAAELRRLAVPYGEREDVCAGDRLRILARADELDPQGGHSLGAFVSRAESLPSDAQRLIPVGPLRILLAGLDQAAARADEHAEGVKARGLEGWAGIAEGRSDCTVALREVLTSLLGESPEPVQEGNHEHR